MFRILFVDDEPEMKVDPLIDWLKEKEISFSYELKRSVNAALRYIDEHSSEINLIVTDLGLPLFDNGEGWTTLRGMLIVDQVVRKKLKIPVIINSTTEPPKEKLQKYAANGTIIKHCQLLNDGRTMLRFVQKNNIHLIESSRDGIFTFWVDSEDEEYVKQCFNQIKNTMANVPTSSLTRESNIIKLDCGDKAVEEAIEFILQTNEDYLFSLQTN